MSGLYLTTKKILKSNAEIRSAGLHLRPAMDKPNSSVTVADLAAPGNSKNETIRSTTIVLQIPNRRLFVFDIMKQ